MCKFLGCKKHRYYRYFLLYLHILHILHIVEHRFYARARTHTRVKGCCTKLCANAQVGRKAPRNRAFPGLHILHIVCENGKFRVVLVRSVFVLAVLRWVTPPAFWWSIGCPGGPGPGTVPGGRSTRGGSDRRRRVRYLCKKWTRKKLEKMYKIITFMYWQHYIYVIWYRRSKENTETENLKVF